MSSLIVGTPCSHSVSDMAAAKLNLGIIAHGGNLLGTNRVGTSRYRFLAGRVTVVS